MTQLLSAKPLRDVLSRLTGWTGDTHGISRTLQLTDGAHAELLERVKVCADALNHYPRIERVGSRTKVLLRTVVAGGVTDADIRLAARIDGIVARITGHSAATGA